jgi:hypothetical protein
MAHDPKTQATTFPMAVPTVTVLAYHPDDPFQVTNIEHQPTKHNGKLTPIGGKYPLRAGVAPVDHLRDDEWPGEAGGEEATLEDIVLWAIKTDHQSDVRQATIKKVTDGDCPTELETTLVEASYGCPDYIFIARVNGTPAPAKGTDPEARACTWVDTREIRITEDPSQSRYGAQLDLVMKVYCYWRQGRWQLQLDDFVDFKVLRARLLAKQQEQ